MTHQVDFVVRSDAIAKPGGDTAQVLAYAATLEAAGFDIRIVPFSLGLIVRPGAVVHLSNVDRTFEFLGAARRSRGNSLMVSPIHRDERQFRQMLRQAWASGCQKLFNRLPSICREGLVYGKRCVLSESNTSWLAIKELAYVFASLLAWKRLVRKVIDSATFVLVIAEGEQKSLERDFGCHGRNTVVVRNGVPTSTEKLSSWDERPPESLVCVGRIEPGKRQVELALAARKMGIPISFIGAPGGSGRYVKFFRAVLSADDSLEWVGHLEAAEIMKRLGGSRVLVNASLLEVQSLVDLEAATQGCFVVSGPPGYSEELLPPEILRKLDSSSLMDILNEARSLANGNSAPSCSYSPPTWAAVTSRLPAYFSRAAGACG